jgi:lauroyl/myristoyl acyltransferase
MEAKPQSIVVWQKPATIADPLLWILCWSMTLSLWTLCILSRWKYSIWLQNRQILQDSTAFGAYSKTLWWTAWDLSLILCGSPYQKVFGPPAEDPIWKNLAKGGILYSAHFGPFELFSAALFAKIPHFRGAYRPLKSSWAQKLWHQRRCELGGFCNPQINAPQPVLSHLKAQGLFGMMIDQDHRGLRQETARLKNQTLRVDPWISLLAQQAIQSQNKTHSLEESPGSRPIFWGLLRTRSFFAREMHLVQFPHSCEHSPTKSDFPSTPDETQAHSTDSLKKKELWEWLHTQLALEIQRQPAHWHMWWHRRFRGIQELKMDLTHDSKTEP